MIETTAFPVDSLLPLRGIAVTLRFLAPSRPYLFHQAPLAGFLRTLVSDDAGSESPLVIDAPESGRVHYRAGDRYRFAVLAPSDGEAALEALMKALIDLPFSASRRDDRLPFRNNLALVSITDLFGSAHARDVSELRPFDASALRSEATVWAGAPGIVLRWLSPARLLREKGQRAGAKGEARFCRDALQLDFGLLQERVIDTLMPLVKIRRADPGARPGFSTTVFSDADLFWIDGAYLDEYGREHQMGGMMGRLQLPVGELPPETDWVALTLGQYLGIGQRRSFGFGRYRLESLAGDFTCTRIGPATSILERVVDPNNLNDAFRHVRANALKEAPTRSHTQPETAWLAEADEEDEAADAAEKIENVGARLATRRYQPPPLRDVVITEADGDLRPLAIPPFWDRVAQRAVVQTISPGIEPLMYYGSFGYRPGRSRHGASRMIERAFQAGYRWVFESDVDDFFDTVAWTRLETRLRALYGDDPIVDLLLDWVAAPVIYQNQQVDRVAGLPQGSPVSPMLANLMLDDFDSDLATAGFRLVRFADDFLVLCKDREQALAASQAARTSLRELGLEVNKDKTRVTHFDEGFRYLGYLFVGGLILDVAGESHKETQGDKNIAPPPNSWLAQLARRPMVPLTKTGRLKTKAREHKPP